MNILGNVNYNTMTYYAFYNFAPLEYERSSDSKHILARVSFITSVSIAEMRSKLRNRTVSDARKAYYCLARFDTKLSLLHIGKEVERDHATVLYGISSYYLHEVTQIIKRYYADMNKPKLAQKYYDLIKRSNRLKDQYVEAVPKQSRLSIEAMAHIKHDVFTEPEYRHILTDYLAVTGKSVKFEQLFENTKTVKL